MSGWIQAAMQQNTIFEDVIFLDTFCVLQGTIKTLRKTPKEAGT